MAPLEDIGAFIKQAREDLHAYHYASTPWDRDKYGHAVDEVYAKLKVFMADPAFNALPQVEQADLQSLLEDLQQAASID